MSDMEHPLLEEPAEAPVKSASVAVPDSDMIRRIVEAALLASNQPMTLQQLYALFPEDAPAPKDSIEQAIEALRLDAENRGVELVEVASGFRYQVRGDVHAWVARMWTERSTRYTRATLETLALIAYRQPITRGEIEQIRGVAVSSNIIKLLEERDWIRVIGHRDVPGKPALLGTTKAFLDYFGLKSLDELPPLAEIRDLTEIEPQLPLDDAPIPATVATTAFDDRDDTSSGADAKAASRGGGAQTDRVEAEETGPAADSSEADDAVPDDSASDEAEPPFPNLDEATDVVIDPSIPATAATGDGPSQDDAGPEAASEHIA